MRLILAGIFLWAGAAKWGATRIFAAEIARLQLAPFLWSEWIAAILPACELLNGLLLICAWRTRAAALAALTLSTLFAFAAAQAIWRGLDMNCACFGPTESPPPPAFVLARALLLGLAAALLRRTAA